MPIVAYPHLRGMRNTGLLLFSAFSTLLFLGGCAARGAEDGSGEGSEALGTCGNETDDGGAPAPDGATPTTPGAEGAACGSRGLAPCAAGLLCIYDEADQCGALDRPGTCVDMRAVRCSSLGTGVCGC